MAHRGLDRNRLTGEDLVATDEVLRKAVVQKFLYVSIESAIASIG